MNEPSNDWALKLFERSPLKRRKLRMIEALLGPSEGRTSLDIGSDNGVISLLLRRRGGEWWSADLTEETVRSITSLVGERVARINGHSTPFAGGQFDTVVIVDLLEHLDDDRAFVAELSRIMKPGGELIVNVPNPHEGPIRRLRYALGQTDQAHGHVRPGYSEAALAEVLAPYFTIEISRSYGRAFSELFDTGITLLLDLLKGGRGKKGTVVTGEDLGKLKRSFRLYRLIAPFASLFVALDEVVRVLPTNMLIVKARHRR